MGLPAAPGDNEMITPSQAKARVPRALLWTSLLRVVVRSLGVVTILVLARLIPPEQYGIFATILIANQILGAAVSVRLDLVQTPKDPRPYLNTAWTTELTRGVVLFVLTQALAQPWCDLFRVPEAAPLLRVLAFVHVIFAFHNTGTDLLRRELRFGRIFILHATEAITYSVVTIAVAFALHSAWALVAGTLVSFAARVVASYALTPIRGHVGFEWSKFTEMFRFSRWTNAYILLDFIVETADNAVVARVANPTALAFYRMGYQIATEGSTALQFVVTSVAYPAVARLQFDREHVRQSFRGILGLASSSLFPITALLVVLGPVLVPLALGDRWAPAAAPLQVLALAAFARGLLETARPVLLGIGRSWEDFLLKVVQAVTLLAIVIPAGIVAGVDGVARGVLAAALLSLPAWVYFLRTRVGITARDFVEPALAPVIATAVAASIIMLLPAAEVSWPSLLGHGAAFALAYVVSSGALLGVLPRSGIAVARHSLR